IMHFFKLHGRSFIPMFLGFGCSIPGILATRTLTNRRDRLLTILAVPFASCSARLPVYALFIAAFFPTHKAAVLFTLYAIGIVMGLLSALIVGRLLFPKEEAPLVMELPPYRLPSPRVVLATAWQRTLIFVKKAGTIILGVTVLIWALASLPPGVEYASENSLAGKLGKVVAPVFKPAGFGSWQASVALLTGILAKEAVVSTMGVLYTGEEVEEEEAEEELTPHLRRNFTPLSAFAFLLMTLLYIPCVAAVGAIRREAGWRWALFTAVYTLFVGWLVATLFYQIASLFA
ncbi:MAG: ferrous iron transporter B, partial [Planctomycetota bacterium]